MSWVFSILHTVVPCIHSLTVHRFSYPWSTTVRKQMILLLTCHQRVGSRLTLRHHASVTRLTSSHHEAFYHLTSSSEGWVQYKIFRERPLSPHFYYTILLWLFCFIIIYCSSFSVPTLWIKLYHKHIRIGKKNIVYRALGTMQGIGIYSPVGKWGRLYYRCAQSLSYLAGGSKITIKKVFLQIEYKSVDEKMSPGKQQCRI